nr:DNA-binding protein [Gammaproteobacteria bacterium]
MSDYHLAPGLPIPVAEADGLSAPFWDGLREEKILLQQCRRCATWQWGPE